MFISKSTARDNAALYENRPLLIVIVGSFEATAILLAIFQAIYIFINFYHSNQARPRLSAYASANAALIGVMVTEVILVLPLLVYQLPNVGKLRLSTILPYSY